MTIAAVPAHDVRRAVAADADTLTTVLARAFFDDPVMRWAIPSDDRRREIDGPLFELFVRAYLPLGETYSAASGGGAALWAPPGGEAVPADDAEAFAAKIEQIAGPDATRLFELIGLMEEHHPHEPLYYLQLLGVDPGLQGRGIGSALLDRVLARADRESLPAYLEATSGLNRKLYEKHGFVATAEVTLPGGPPFYSMWREPRT
ncbi:MAG TPA: GNAT family N-acetyltransferase [Gaiellaceae bacterium]|nr:GNAT family N-acetyltransferase [Gaiellaceae bacterium]